MKRKFRFGALLSGAVLLSSCVLGACGGVSEGVARSVKFPDVIQETGEYLDLEDFAAQDLTNDATVDGVIVSPYYDVSFAGGDVYSYAVPLYSGEIHSFGYIEATEDMFPLDITITVDYPDEELQSAVVIPDKFGVEAKVTSNKVRFTIESFDYYTVLFNGKYNFERPYTLFVREYKEVDIPSGYNVIEFEPGLHFVDKLTIKEDNTFIYLHSGAYLMCKQPSEYTEKNKYDAHNQKVWDAFMHATGKKNVRVGGYGVIDFSNLSWHARSPINFSSCTNVTIEGITLINSPSWSIFLTDCKDILIRDVIMLAYRQNSDGSVICNSKNALIENTFIRSGDDLFEVKAQVDLANNTQTGGENITYRHCQAWADKTRSFGFIQETRMNVNGLLFEDCTSLYQGATWEPAMGAFIALVGDDCTVENVVFRDCDSYYCKGNVINISVETNQWTTSGTCYGTLHDVTVENFRYNSDGFEFYQNGVRNDMVVGIRLNNTREDGTADHYYNIALKNLVRDGKPVNSWADIAAECSMKGKFRNVTLNGVGIPNSLVIDF